MLFGDVVLTGSVLGHSFVTKGEKVYIVNNQRIHQLEKNWAYQGPFYFCPNVYSHLICRTENDVILTREGTIERISVEVPRPRNFYHSHSYIFDGIKLYRVSIVPMQMGVTFHRMKGESSDVEISEPIEAFTYDYDTTKYIPWWGYNFPVISVPYIYYDKVCILKDDKVEIIEKSPKYLYTLVIIPIIFKNNLGLIALHWPLQETYEGNNIHAIYVTTDYKSGKWFGAEKLRIPQEKNVLIIVSNGDILQVTNFSLKDRGYVFSEIRKRREQTILIDLEKRTIANKSMFVTPESIINGFILEDLKESQAIKLEEKKHELIALKEVKWV